MPRREPPLRPGRKEKSVVNLWPWNMRKISNFLLLFRESFRLFFLIENLNFVVFGFPLELFGIKSRRILWAREHNVCASGYAIKLATEKRKLKKKSSCTTTEKKFRVFKLNVLCVPPYVWMNLWTKLLPKNKIFDCFWVQLARVFLPMSKCLTDVYRSA